MKSQSEYIKQLEETLRKFLEPINDIPYPVVIKSLTGHKVLKFSKNRNRKLLSLLKKAAQIAGENAYNQGIITARPNEAGNKMEKFVLEALKQVGLTADKPKTKSGKVKVAGYPDIEIKYQNKTIYLDCKTYSSKTKNQTFRTFYLSPSKDPKITTDAYHLLLSFELEKIHRQGKYVFVPISWQLYTLENLKIQIKHEFNASNRDLYREEYLLANGKIEV